MSKKIILLIIGSVLLLFLIVIGIIYFRSPSGTAPSITTSIRNLFPFGEKTNDVGVTPPTNTTTPPPDTTQPPMNGTTPLIPKLRHISTEPVAGGVAFNTTRTITIPVAPAPIEGDSGGVPGSLSIVPPPIIKTEPAIAIRYLETKTAHVYQTYTDSLDTEEISNTTIPRIHDATWDSTGSSVALRYLDTDTNKIETYLAALKQTPTSTAILIPTGSDTPVETTPYTLVGTYLPENISDMTALRDQTKLFYITPQDGGVFGTITDFAGLKKSQFWNSSFSEWLGDFPNTSTVTVTTKPSNSFGGYVYSINTTTGGMTKILGNISGLTTLMSPDGKKLIYGASVGSSYSLYSYDLQTQTTTNLGLSTLPEKCVWQSNTLVFCGVPKSMPSGPYPDSWYQGLVTFDDALWRINLDTGIFDIVVDPTTAGESQIDMTRLSTDPSGNFIYFINKIDGSFWSYQLN